MIRYVKLQKIIIKKMIKYLKYYKRKPKEVKKSVKIIKDTARIKN